VLGIAAAGLAMAPDDADAVQRLQNSVNQIQNAYNSGDTPSDDVKNDFMVAAKDVYGNDTLALWAWGELEGK
jgi:hypothetical protein